MGWIETRREAGWDGPARTQPLREAITGAAAVGFLAGGSVGLALGGGSEPHPLWLYALSLPLGAIAAAIAAGIVVNLVALPLLCRLAPEHRLPDAVYRAAGALSALAAFAGAFVAVSPSAP